MDHKACVTPWETFPTLRLHSDAATESKAGSSLLAWVRPQLSTTARRQLKTTKAH